MNLEEFVNKYVIMKRLNSYTEDINFWINKVENGEILYNELMTYTNSNVFHQAIYNYVNKTTDQLCLHCGKITSFKTFSKGYSRFCSLSCGTYGSKELKENTCIEKYGVKSPTQSKVIKEKIKATSMINHGVEHYRQNPEMVKKASETLFNKTGYHNPMQNPETKLKAKQTCLATYGVEYSLQSEAVKEKGIKTSLEKYGAEHYVQSEAFRESIKVKTQN